MKIAAVIVEYNPFHNGHLYHLQQAKKITGADFLIAIMSTNVVQRGEFAVIDKIRRTKVALENGIDLVIELPAIYTLQSSQSFAKGAVKLLNYAGVTDLVFGSETNNLEYLIKLSDLEINLDYLKEIMKTGISYPKAMGKLTDSLYPNDLLAVAYLKEIKKYSNITPHIIARTNSYNSLDIHQNIASATAIRNALFKKQDFKNTTIMHDQLLIFNNRNDNYFNIIKYALLSQTPKELSTYLLVNEGIERHLIKQVLISSNYEEFIGKCITKRYTKVKIQRTIMNIVFRVRKKDKYQLERIKHLRILGFNRKATKLLSDFNKRKISYSVKYNQIPHKQRKLEYKIAQLYQLYFQDKELLNKEIKLPIIIK